ncbi:drug/metabolite transporter (DMT)-like permease [Streptomyces sp. V3I8]|uniref:DMT family transporter n=1 Tax=Streptomyces sp. V3I8 TaxID=3042279 RepID=UPI00278197AF|nr:DMT family transporter [Streptomyces sp. V3I8]MDQ1040103.1 drug/metabolite transporter (DMT)-like permease [Streptomyces sp. V3I8]
MSAPTEPHPPLPALPAAALPAAAVPAATVPGTEGRPGPGRVPAAAPAAPAPVLDWRLRFGALSLVWGFSFLLIKVGTDGYAPFQVTLGRLLFGTLVLAAAMAWKRERLPSGARTWGHLAVAALLLNALPFSLFAYSELTIPSTLAGICNATSPLWGMALSMVALSEDRPTRHRVAGLGIGFLGVLTVLGVWQGFHGLDAAGTAMALFASLSYPVGWIYVRRTLAGSGHSHLSLTGAQLLLATAQLAFVTPLFTSAPARFALVPLLAVIALGALGTGFALLVQYGLVAEVGPTTAQMVTYFIPVIATAAGVAILGEPLAWSTPVGAAVVLAGAALTRSGPRTPRSRPGRGKEAAGTTRHGRDGGGAPGQT